VTADPVLAAALRGGLALLFATAAAHKLRDLAGFRATLAAYRLLPAFAVGAFAVAAVALEVAAAAALALGAIASLAAPGHGVAAVGGAASGGGTAVGGVAIAGVVAAGPALAAALLAVYTGAIAVNVARGRTDLDCGCLGPALRQPVGAGVLARNAILIAASLACLLPVRERALGWLDAFTAVAAVATAAALYAASQHLIATAPGLAGLRAEARER
jgi:hypothetical protein